MKVGDKVELDLEELGKLGLSEISSEHYIYFTPSDFILVSGICCKECVDDGDWYRYIPKSAIKRVIKPEPEPELEYLIRFQNWRTGIDGRNMEDAWIEPRKATDCIEWAIKKLKELEQ